MTSRSIHSAHGAARLGGVLLVAGWTLQGCVSSTPPAQAGIRVGDATLEQFKAGVTTEGWLVAVLGPPTSSSVVEGIENTKVFRYATGESASGLGSIFSGKASRNTAVVYFIITDGVVTRFWADRATERTLLGTEVPESSGEKAGGKAAP